MPIIGLITEMHIYLDKQAHLQITCALQAYFKAFRSLSWAQNIGVPIKVGEYQTFGDKKNFPDGILNLK